MSEWGNLSIYDRSPPLDGGRAPGEVKHFSTRRNRKQNKVFSFWSNFIRKNGAIMTREKILAIPLVAASETGVAQTDHVYMVGVVGR